MAAVTYFVQVGDKYGDFIIVDWEIYFCQKLMSNIMALCIVMAVALQSNFLSPFLPLHPLAHGSSP